MCSLAVEGSWLTVDSWEIKNPTEATMVEVMRHCKESHSKHENVVPMLVCGADLLESFTKREFMPTPQACFYLLTP